MKELHEGVAVITGAASGIGLALARRAAREGMRLVLADINAENLKVASAELELPSDRLHLSTVDVSREDDVKRLADEAFAQFGAVNLLCNNAGIGLTRLTWEYTIADWEWVLGVDLWSVIYSVHHFLPRMLAQNNESHIVNTASAAGLLSTPGMAPYNVSKHGVVTLSETLYAELTAQSARVGVSVLCPAWVPTNIRQSARARPERFGTAAPPSEASVAYQARSDQAIQSGRLTADDMANAVFHAVSENRFYVIPHRKLSHAVRTRMEDIIEARKPTSLG